MLYVDADTPFRFFSATLTNVDGTAALSRAHQPS